MKSRRDRERERYNREARQAFGVTARVSEPPAATGQPMSHALDEERRLTAKHDPTKPSGRRLCGVTVEPGAGEVAGWKCCRACLPLIAGGMGALLSALLAEAVEPSEAAEVLSRAGLPAPSYFLGRWPTDGGQPAPWAHLPDDYTERARMALRELRLRSDGSGAGEHARDGLRVAWGALLDRVDRGPVAHWRAEVGYVCCL